LFGVEVWRWLNENRLDGIKWKYVIGVQNLDRRTPKLYIVGEDEDEGIKDL